VEESYKSNDLGLTSNLTVLGCFFKDTVSNSNEWCMKCNLCSCKIKSRPTITSNFHRYLRVSALCGYARDLTVMFNPQQ